MGCLPPFSTGAGFRSHPPYGDLMDFHGIFHVSMSVSEGYPGLWRTSLQMASPWPQGNSCHYWCTVFPTRATTGHSWLVGGIPTPLKNDGVRQLGWSFPIYGKIKSVPNHQPAGHSWNVQWFSNHYSFEATPKPTAPGYHQEFPHRLRWIPRAPEISTIPSSDPKTLRDLPTKMGRLGTTITSKNWRLVFPCWWIDNYVAPVYIYIRLCPNFVGEILSSMLESFRMCKTPIFFHICFDSLVNISFFYCHRWNFHLCSVDLDCVLLVGEMSISVGHKPPCFPSLLVFNGLQLPFSLIVG